MARFLRWWLALSVSLATAVAGSSGVAPDPGALRNSTRSLRSRGRNWSYFYFKVAKTAASGRPVPADMAGGFDESAGRIKEDVASSIGSARCIHPFTPGKNTCVDSRLYSCIGTAVEGTLLRAGYYRYYASPSAYGLSTSCREVPIEIYVSCPTKAAPTVTLLSGTCDDTSTGSGPTVSMSSGGITSVLCRKKVAQPTFQINCPCVRDSSHKCLP
jgi:hypothetical protein